MQFIINKPCPFCGEESDFDIQRGTPDSEGTPTNVSCVSCGANGPWVYEVGDNFTQAIKAWEDRKNS